MKVNEFIKDKGIDEAKRHLECYGWRNTPFIIKLKRLVESHELVEKLGGLDEAKIYVPDGYKSERLKQAIADVESCQ